MKKKYIKLLLSTDIPGMINLVDALEKGGFFTSPCSSKYHLASEGGLLKHSLNVYKVLCQLNKAMNAGIESNDIIVCALLHDIGKMGFYGKPAYVTNFVKSKTKNKETGDYDLVVSDAKPYKHNPDLTYEEHEIMSALIASKHIDLTEDQATAILHHNGLYGKLDSSFSDSNQNYCKTKLAYLLHVADMYCSRFIEE